METLRKLLHLNQLFLETGRYPSFNHDKTGSWHCRSPTPTSCSRPARRPKDSTSRRPKEAPKECSVQSLKAGPCVSMQHGHGVQPTKGFFGMFFRDVRVKRSFFGLRLIELAGHPGADPMVSEQTLKKNPQHSSLERGTWASWLVSSLCCPDRSRTPREE